MRTTLLLLLCTISLGGCNLYLITTKGGHIVSASTYRDCSSNQACEILVTTSAFHDSFTAVANPGYEFVGWQEGDGFLCGASQSDQCSVDLRPLQYNPAIEQLVASHQNGYIMPIFRKLDEGTVTPQIVDGHGAALGNIIEESYPSWATYQHPFSGAVAKARYSFAQESFAWTPPSHLYFIGDTCDPDMAYSPVYSTQDADSAFGPYGDIGSFYILTNNLEVGVTVGSQLLNGQGSCVDIADTTLNLYETVWLGVDDSVKPITRYGSPPCAGASTVPNCY